MRLFGRGLVVNWKTLGQAQAEVLIAPPPHSLTRKALSEMGVKPQLITVSGAAIGRNPFDQRSWSGSSYFFFSELQRHGLLHKYIVPRAFSAKGAIAVARTFSPHRSIWRRRLFLDGSYRSALTESVRRQISSIDEQFVFLQIAGYYDVPSALPASTRTFAYYDGNLALAMRAPYKLQGLSRRLTTGALEYEREMLQGIETVFTMSEHLRRSFIDDYGVAGDRVVSVGGGINLPQFPGPPKQKNYESREILFIGSDFLRKGGRNLLSAFQVVVQRFPDAILHVVGPRSIGQSVPHNVILHGYLPRSSAQLASLFDRCSLFVLPSLWEPFGIAPLEAMAHGLPAVVTGDWALGETVIDGVTGRHVEAGSEESLAYELCTLLADPDLMATMGSVGREHVLDNYTWPIVVAKMRASIFGPSDAQVGG